jgi:copper oxidase (laccase) domain-containing protein
MMKEFGSLPENILVGIGPCINSCCYEVDAPVVNSFKNAFPYWNELIEDIGKWEMDVRSCFD